MNFVAYKEKYIETKIKYVILNKTYEECARDKLDDHTATCQRIRC